MRGALGDLATALLAVAAVLLLAALARRVAESEAPPGRVAIGPLADPHVIAIEAVYGSFAREAAEGGELRVHQHQTSREHRPVLARPLEWVLGRWAAALQLGPRATYDAIRVAAVPVVALGLLALLVMLVRDRAVRRGALVAALLGGNLYWLVEVLGRDSFGWARTWLDGTHPGTSGLGYGLGPVLSSAPHLALEIGFFTLAVAAALAGARARRPVGVLAGAAGTGMAVVALACVRPYTVPIALAAAGLAFLSQARTGPRPRRIAAVIAPLLATAPVLPYLWHVWRVLSRDTPFAGLDVVHPAPPPLELALFCGAPLLGAAMLLLPSVRRRRGAAGGLDGPARGALLGWGLVNIAILFGGPVIAWEVEALQTLPVLALLLAALALEGLAPRARAAAGAALLLAVLAGGASWALEVRRGLGDETAPYWIDEGDEAVFDYLGGQRGAAGLAADRTEPVLVCAPELARLVPWLAGCRVYLGHPDHTPDYVLRTQRLGRLLATGEGLGELAGQGVTHLMFGDRERGLQELVLRGTGIPAGGAWDPATDPGLREVTRHGVTMLYSILPAD